MTDKELEKMLVDKSSTQILGMIFMVLVQIGDGIALNNHHLQKMRENNKPTEPPKKSGFWSKT